jgi:hypothetical protein
MSTARVQLGGAGTQTAALAFGGHIHLLLQEQQKNMMEQLGNRSWSFKYSKKEFSRSWNSNSWFSFWWYEYILLTFRQQQKNIMVLLGLQVEIW